MKVFFCTIGICLMYACTTASSDQKGGNSTNSSNITVPENSVSVSTTETDESTSKKQKNESVTTCPAQSMIDFFKQKGKLLETKESLIGTYSDKEVEMKTVFQSCMPKTISIHSKTSKADGFYMYADGILVTYDSIDPQGNHIHHYVENVRSNTKLPKHVITDFNK